MANIPRWRRMTADERHETRIFFFTLRLRLHCPGPHMWNINASVKKWNIFFAFLASMFAFAFASASALW